MKKTLLLHICCAPCGVYVFDQLSRDYHVTGYFFNPNIHPESEYRFRERELRKLAKGKNWPVILGEYRPERWFSLTKDHKNEPERGQRCTLCFRMRLDSTFTVAQKRGFQVIASTLSISPYKTTSQINAVGQSLQKKYGIEFLAENFKRRDGFLNARRMAHAHNIQHQDYCGCTYSRLEREKRRRVDRS